MFEKFKRIPIYRGYLGLIISKNFDKIVNIIPDFDSREIYAHAIYHEYNQSEAFTIVLNFKNKYRQITHGVIAHEAVHIAHMIFQTRGVTPDADNDEPFAYLVEWVVDEIYSCLLKNKISV